MKTIIFISTRKSGSSREAIKAAERLGYYTVLFDNKLIRFPEVRLMEVHDLNNINELKEATRLLVSNSHEIDAIVSFVDPYCYTSCLLAEEFGVNRFTSQAINAMQDKVLSRQVLSKSCYNPYYAILPENTLLPREEVESRLPLMVKSPYSAGSEDVFKVNTYKDFERRIRKFSVKYPSVPVLVEEFIDGPQYLVETIVYKKQLHIVAAIEQEITFTNGYFIVTGYNLMTDPQASLYKSLEFAVESIVKQFGMELGSCHLEMRYVNNQWKLIEINPRISGGGMNKLLKIGLGIDLVEEILKLSLGQEINVEPKYKEHTFAQYVILSKTGTLDKITGMDEASNCPGVKAVEILVKKGSLLSPPHSMANRYAYVIATGESEQEARENAKNAASKIHFHIVTSEGQKPEEVGMDTNLIK